MDSLKTLHENHQGKVSDKWTRYLEDYDPILTPYRNQAINLLEIGVQNGGSLEVWSKYFPEATHIIGCDINEKCQDLHYDDPRIRIIIGDAGTDATKQQILAIVPTFDIIIDDGSHTSGDIVRNFTHYFDRLNDNGTFIIEDLHCSYWQEFDGGLYHPYSAINFLKNLADIVNHEHWGLPLRNSETLEEICQHYNVITPSSLAHIHSVEFINSICVIKKRAIAENELGSRIIVGQDASVEPNRKQDNNTRSVAPNQSESPYPHSTQAIIANLRAQLIAVQQNLEAAQLKHQQDEQTLQTQLTQLSQLAQLEDELVTMQKQLEFVEKTKAEEAKNAAALKEELQAAQSQLNNNQQQQQENQNLQEHIANLDSHITGLNNHITSLHQHINILQTRTQRISKLWTFRLLKPLFKTEQAISSANRYRKGFRLLVREKGSIGKAYQTVRRTIKKNGIKSAKQLLKNYLSNKNNDNAHSSYLSHHDNNDAVIVNNVVADLFFKQQNEFSFEEIKNDIATFSQTPKISVLIPVYNTPEKWLRRVIESLQDQIYTNWELCVVDDCSTHQLPRQIIKELSEQDKRIRYHFSEKNQGISKTSNIALDMAKGEFIALVDHDDEITPDAFYWIVKAINENENVEFIYSDECKIDDTDARHLYFPILKPDWSPEIMINGMITGHLTAYKTDIVREIGGFRSEYDFSQDYDLALRMGRICKNIIHIERILYLWRSISGSAASGDKPYARISNLKALQDHLNQLNVPAKIRELPHANSFDMVLNEAKLVSIIIPSDSYKNLTAAIDEIIKKTDYENYEIIAVCNSQLMRKLVKKYQNEERIKFSAYDKLYNFSDKCNQGAKDANGEFIIFYNDDVFPLQDNWLSKLISYLYLPDVGGVSPKLLYENNLIQYAGMISGTPGLAGTAYHCYGKDEQSSDYLLMNNYVRNVSILSGACCAFKRDIFLKVGGFDSINTPDGHSDVDLSFKIRSNGYRCVYTPYSVLYHIGNHSWGGKKGKYKADIFCLKHWGEYISKDPYFTDTMKKVFYKDFIFNYKIYTPNIQPNQIYTGKDVLFISHELTASGAPNMIYYAALAVKENGGFPVVVSPTDGVMRQRFIDAGITVIIDESINYDHFLFKEFAKNFDKVVVNTIALAHVVDYLSNIDNLDILWWLHESQSLAHQLPHYLDIAKRNVRIICVSNYAKSFVPEQFSAEILLNGIKQHNVEKNKNKERNFTFLLLGTIEPRKGQDIFCQAITRLDKNIVDKCNFVLAGKLWDGNQGFFQENIEPVLKNHPTVEYKGSVSPDFAHTLISNADVLVSCSRDDPLPLVTIEAAQHSKALILNENVGTSEIFEKEGGCLLFKSENADSLANQMKFAYENQEKMKQMGLAAHKSFEQHFTFEKFSESFISLINDE